MLLLLPFLLLLSLKAPVPVHCNCMEMSDQLQYAIDMNYGCLQVKCTRWAHIDLHIVFERWDSWSAYSMVNIKSFWPCHTSVCVKTWDDMSSPSHELSDDDSFDLSRFHGNMVHPGLTDHMFSHTCVSMRLKGAIIVSERYGFQYNCFFTTPQSLTHFHFPQTVQTEVYNWKMFCQVYTAQCIFVTI